MLFNSYPFILLFLPVVLAGYFWLGRRSNLAPVIWLALASITFYAIGSWQFLALLLVSIAFNYGVGHLLIVAELKASQRRAALAFGVIGDLLVLGIFKYAGFAAENINALLGTHVAVHILLPVGISFYTFTQIAFLVDAYRGQVAAYALPHYTLFVTYYPESELSDTAAFETALTDLFLGPDEGLGSVVVCVDVGIDVFLKLLEAREGGAAERLPLQDGKPYFDLIEP
ncbi:D-alanyl-lipoteichoic acid acyltransferase DltB (MBOAT superfamily) [Bradyrhizobium liaoningense]|nr:hypothetical protein GCM10007858_28580 [Bradyrhizobium liaoningense]